MSTDEWDWCYDGWSGIIAIATPGNTYGLRADGTVIYQCYLVSGDGYSILDTDYWYDIAAISAGARFLVGLRSDGTVVSTFYSDLVSDWRDIIAIAAGDDYIVGLTSSGTVVIAEESLGGVRSAMLWSNIRQG